MGYEIIGWGPKPEDWKWRRTCQGCGKEFQADERPYAYTDFEAMHGAIYCRPCFDAIYSNTTCTCGRIIVRGYCWKFCPDCGRPTDLGRTQKVIL